MGRRKQRPERALNWVDLSHPSVLFWFFPHGHTQSHTPLPTDTQSKDAPSSVAFNLNNNHSGTAALTPAALPTAAPATAVSVGAVAAPLKKRLIAASEESKGSNAAGGIHPLSRYAEVPPLNEVQTFITEAIMKEKDLACPFDRIYEYVAQRWSSIKRKDGTNYTVDCKRVVQNNLRSTYNHLALFRQDKESGRWLICRSLEESAQAAKDRLSKKDTKLQVTNSKDNEDYSDEDYVPNKDSSNTTQEDAYDKLNPIQKIVCDCIIDDGGSSHFDMIVNHVTKNWSTIPSSVRNDWDSKTATLSALTDSGKLFKRDPKRTGWWTINGDIKIAKSQPVEESNYNRVNTNRNPKRLKKEKEASDEESLSNPEQEDQTLKQLTELQILIMHAIDKDGGEATFDQIYDHVVKRFDQLRRRDGTPYTSDCKKAISSSLSNNSSLPFFKKESRKGAAFWTLTRKSIDFLQDLNKKQDQKENDSISEEVASSSLSSMVSASPPVKKQNGHTNEEEENEDSDEEIRDDEENEEDNSIQEENSDSEPSPRPPLKNGQKSYKRVEEVETRSTGTKDSSYTKKRRR